MRVQGMFLVMMIGQVCSMQTRYHDIFKADQLDRFLKQYEYSVVCYVDKKSDVDMFEHIKNRMMAASKHEDFKEVLAKQVGFMMVNASLPAVKDSLKTYEITEFPSVLIFENKYLHAKVVFEPQTTSEIVGLLTLVLGKQIKEIREQSFAQHRDTLSKHENPYDLNGSNPYAWMVYPQYPYSRWGTGPYGIGYTFDAMVN